ncbi:MAG: hypothetical protein EBX40_05555 [Gammaproteobacteria bacterium]|nr:hypothetical protein [Gammaproteobacteria bacterium]
MTTKKLEKVDQVASKSALKSAQPPAPQQAKKSVRFSEVVDFVTDSSKHLPLPLVEYPPIKPINSQENSELENDRKLKVLINRSIPPKMRLNFVRLLELAAEQVTDILEKLREIEAEIQTDKLELNFDIGSESESSKDKALHKKEQLKLVQNAIRDFEDLHKSLTPLLDTDYLASLLANRIIQSSASNSNKKVVTPGEYFSWAISDIYKKNNAIVSLTNAAKAKEMNQYQPHLKDLLQMHRGVKKTLEKILLGLFLPIILPIVIIHRLVNKDWNLFSTNRWNAFLKIESSILRLPKKNVINDYFNQLKERLESKLSSSEDVNLGAQKLQELCKSHMELKKQEKAEAAKETAATETLREKLPVLWLRYKTRNIKHNDPNADDQTLSAKN